MNPGGRGCGELKLHHCIPAWAIRAKLCLKRKKKREREREEGGRERKKERKKEQKGRLPQGSRKEKGTRPNLNWMDYVSVLFPHICKIRITISSCK